MSKLHATIQAFGRDREEVIASLEKALVELKKADSNRASYVWASPETGFLVTVGGDLRHLLTTSECCTLHTAMEETVNRIRQSPEGYESEESEAADLEVLQTIKQYAGR